MARSRKSKRSTKPGRTGGAAGQAAPVGPDPLVPKAARWAAVAVGVLFLVAGFGKILEPYGFYSALASYGVTGGVRYPLAILLPATELMLGIMLVAGWKRRQAAIVAAAFFVVFIAAIGNGWSQGTLEECGCFGPFLQRSPRDALLIDLVFLGLSLFAGGWLPSRSPALAGWRAITLLFVGVLGMGVVSSVLLGGGGGVAAVAPAMDAVDLSRGEHLLYLFHYECPHCAEMSPRVAAYGRDPALPPVIGFTFRTPQRELDAYLEHYDLRIPAQVLSGTTFGSITGEGAVPQLVYVRGGAIVKTWLGELPFAAELREELARRPR